MVTEKEFEHIRLFCKNTPIADLGYDNWYKQWLFDNKKKEKIKKEFIIIPLFQEFWDLFPVTNYFTYKGREFKGKKRALRQGADIEKCQKLYLIAGRGTEKNLKEINNSLKIYLQQVKEKSIFTGSNQFDFMPGIEPYLRQPRYHSLHVGETFKEVNTQSFDNSIDI